MYSALIVLLTTLASLDAGPGSNWPEFRGPTGTGFSPATGLPEHWSETENIRWKTKIHGKGWSSPVVWGDQVWLTTALGDPTQPTVAADGKERYAVCVNRRTGKILHDIKVFDDPKPAFCIGFNSYASPTPAVEEGQVYVHFGSCGTACLDTATGKILWSRRDLLCDHWHGPGSSPILYGNLLFLLFDGYDRQYVTALDKRTGKTVWQKDRSLDYGKADGDHKKAYCTPSIITVAGKPQLVCPAAVGTEAYDPLTGEVLWRAYHGGMNVAARPIYVKGLVLLCSGDGGLKLIAVRPDGRGDLTKTGPVWKRIRGVPNRSSLLLAGDLVYMVTDPGVVTCIEPKTDEEVWQGRVRGQFVASPVCADGKIYLFSREGPAYVVAAGRSWKLLATNPLDDGCMASPAVAGKALIVRTLTHLYCIEKKGRAE